MICECSDKGCPAHSGQSNCEQAATSTLYRLDMTDLTATAMCTACEDDALDSGLSSTEAAEDDE